VAASQYGVLRSRLGASVPSGGLHHQGLNGCMQVIGLTVEFTGNSPLRSTCTVVDACRIAANLLVRIGGGRVQLALYDPVWSC
jgi:hypothetical protein